MKEFSRIVKELKGMVTFLPKYKKVINEVLDNRNLKFFDYDNENIEFRNYSDLALIAYVVNDACDITKKKIVRKVSYDDFLSYAELYPNFTDTEYSIILGIPKRTISGYNKRRQSTFNVADMPVTSDNFCTYVTKIQLRCLIRDHLDGDKFSINMGLKLLKNTKESSFFYDSLFGDEEALRWIIGDEYLDALNEAFISGKLSRFYTPGKAADAIGIPVNAVQLYARSKASSYRIFRQLKIK